MTKAIDLTFDQWAKLKDVAHQHGCSWSSMLELIALGELKVVKADNGTASTLAKSPKPKTPLTESVSRTEINSDSIANYHERNRTASQH